MAQSIAIEHPKAFIAVGDNLVVVEGEWARILSAKNQTEVRRVNIGHCEDFRVHAALRFATFPPTPRSERRYVLSKRVYFDPFLTSAACETHLRAEGATWSVQHLFRGRSRMVTIESEAFWDQDGNGYLKSSKLFTFMRFANLHDPKWRSKMVQRCTAKYGPQTKPTPMDDCKTQITWTRGKQWPKFVAEGRKVSVLR